MINNYSDLFLSLSLSLNPDSIAFSIAQRCSWLFRYKWIRDLLPKSALRDIADNCPSLISLKLSYCENLDLQEFQALSKIKNLREFTISEEYYNGAFLENLPPVTSNPCLILECSNSRLKKKGTEIREFLEKNGWSYCFVKTYERKALKKNRRLS